MTLPKANDERIVNLFNRANHQRQQNEFDKALATYEIILNEDNANAEAHWCVVLCRYGIEYVEDPKSRERIPTCHRVQYDSILSDADYAAALEHAPDAYTRTLYEEEAKRISEIQKGILVISNQEEPYDIFICYKETSDGGTRTVDSTIAQDIYYNLTNDGCRVFFSKITLEDKLGKQYEPYIFNALNSAKVMLVIGTKLEYFNATWVKNEWSRYLSLMKKDRSLLLIPCYRDMDAYDIPDELANLQSQDMSKVGFIQDILRGVKKVLGASIATEKPTITGTGTTAIAPGVESLTTRGHLFLEDSDWQQADEYFNKALDINPKYAPAYIGRLCTELKVKLESDLAIYKSPLENMSYYQKALRFADLNYHAVLIEYNKIILERIQEEKRIERERIAKLIQQEEKRGWAFLEKSDWKQADKCFNKALELDPKHASAYVGKLCVDLKVCSEALLIDSCQEVNNIEFPAEVISLAKNGNTVEATKLLCENSTLNQKEANAIVKKIYKRIPITEYTTSLMNNANYRQALICADVDYRIKLEEYENIFHEKIIENKRIEQERIRKEDERIAEEKRIRQKKKVEEEKRCRAEQERIAEEKRRRNEERQREQEEQRQREQEEQRQREQEELRRREQRRQWEEQGLCRYCGGQMGGVFTKKCKSCGKAK
jgi:tetratricopeptide (TPR) repeat protein